MPLNSLLFHVYSSRGDPLAWGRTFTDLYYFQQVASEDLTRKGNSTTGNEKLFSTSKLSHVKKLMSLNLFLAIRQVDLVCFDHVVKLVFDNFGLASLEKMIIKII